jgi:hypothetical protein
MRAALQSIPPSACKGTGDAPSALTPPPSGGLAVGVSASDAALMRPIWIAECARAP